MELKVNADVQINVNTIVDTEDPLLAPYSREAVINQALAQIFCGNYEPGDMITDPKINWIECEECGQSDGLHLEDCSGS